MATCCRLEIDYLMKLKPTKTMAMDGDGDSDYYYIRLELIGVGQPLAWKAMWVL